MPHAMHVQLCGIDTLNVFAIRENSIGKHNIEDIIEAIISHSQINLKTHEVFFHLDSDLECHVVHIRHLFDHISKHFDSVGICLHALLRSPSTQLADEAGMALRLDGSSKLGAEKSRSHIEQATTSVSTELSAPLPTPPEADDSGRLDERTNKPRQFLTRSKVEHKVKDDQYKQEDDTVLARKRKRVFGSESSADESDDSIGSHIEVAAWKRHAA